MEVGEGHGMEAILVEKFSPCESNLSEGNSLYYLYVNTASSN